MQYLSCQILQRHFSALKKSTGVSLRSWSAIVDLSPTYVSLVFNSKRFPNVETLAKLGEHLQMDKEALARLKDAYLLDLLKKNKIKAIPLERNSRSSLDPALGYTIILDSNS